MRSSVRRQWPIRQRGANPVGMVFDLDDSPTNAYVLDHGAGLIGRYALDPSGRLTTTSGTQPDVGASASAITRVLDPDDATLFVYVAESDGHIRVFQSKLYGDGTLS